MKTRKLQDGTEVEEFDTAVTLTVYTKCPEKYMLIDMQTGEKYVGTKATGNRDWRKLDA
jgi:hypothetical protein